MHPHCRPEAITMPDPDVLAYTGSLFPSFPSQTPSISASRAASSDVRGPVLRGVCCARHCL